MGFSNKNDSLPYFAILRELSPDMSLPMDLVKTFGSLSLLASFFRGGGGAGRT